MLPGRAGPRRTAIGGLVFGREDDKVQDFRPPSVPPLEAKETRQFLEAGLLYPKPLPWAPPAGPRVTPEDEASTPKSRPEVAFQMNQPQLAVRLAACERRLDVQEAQALVLKRLESNFEQYREGSEVRNRVDIERTVKLEAMVQQLQRDEINTRDKMTAFQAEFRDFASQSLGRHRADHADIEGQVGQALARQNLSAEEWRNSMRQKDAQIQAELERMTSSVEDLREKLMSSQAELRVRLTSLEIPSHGARGNESVVHSGNGLGAADGAYLMQAVDFMKQQIEKLHRGSNHAGAGLSELQARLDGEAAARATAQQDHNARLEALNQALGASRALMAQSISQRIEVIEERLGVERKDILAKQDRLRDEMSFEGQEGSDRMRELISRFRTEIENTERKCQLETERLRDDMENHLGLVRDARLGDEEARKASVAGLMKRAEGMADRQLDHVRAWKQEVDASVRSVREAVSAESNARTEAERKLLEQVSEVVQESLKGENLAVQRSMKHQADLVAAEFEQMRRVNSDRADRLSRYIDHALAHAGVNMGIKIKDGAGSDVGDLKERMAAMRKELEELALSFETRFDHFANDVKSKLKRAGDQQESEVRATRREAEKAAAAVEQRWLAGNEELKKRFEAYVNHFDSAINSVQAAILRPALRDPKALGFLASAAPRARAEAEATVSPRAVREEPEAATQPIPKIEVQAAPYEAAPVQTLPTPVTQSPPQVSPEEPEAATQPIPKIEVQAAPVQTLPTPVTQSPPQVSPALLLPHERVQQRKPLEPIEATTQFSSPRDPMAVQELRSTKGEVEEAMADEVVANLWGKAPEDSDSNQETPLDSARTLAPERF